MLTSPQSHRSARRRLLGSAARVGLLLVSAACLGLLLLAARQPSRLFGFFEGGAEEVADPAPPAAHTDPLTARFSRANPDTLLRRRDGVEPPSPRSTDTSGALSLTKWVWVLWQVGWVYGKEDADASLAEAESAFEKAETHLETAGTSLDAVPTAKEEWTEKEPR